MRWRLLVITSLAAAVVACGLWSTLAIALYGSARELARHDWFLLASAALPLVFVVYAGVFAYRHTARRRKTQAMITAVLALLLTIGFYLAASQLLPNRLVIMRSDQDARARKRMLIGSRKHFVIEVMEQANQAPLIFVRVRFAIPLRGGAHRRFNCDRVFTQAIAFRVFAQQLPRFVTIGHKSTN